MNEFDEPKMGRFHFRGSKMLLKPYGVGHQKEEQLSPMQSHDVWDEVIGLNGGRWAQN